MQMAEVETQGASRNLVFLGIVLSHFCLMLLPKASKVAEPKSEWEGTTQ